MIKEKIITVTRQETSASQEAYEGGRISLATGVAARPAFKGKSNPIYDAAHDASTDQSPLTETDIKQARTHAQNITAARNFIKNNPSLVAALLKIKIR